MAISDNPAPSWYKKARAASHVNLTLAGLTSWLSELTTPIDKVVFIPLVVSFQNLKATRRSSRGGFLVTK